MAPVFFGSPCRLLSAKSLVISFHKSPTPHWESKHCSSLLSHTSKRIILLGLGGMIYFQVVNYILYSRMLPVITHILFVFVICCCLLPLCKVTQVIHVWKTFSSVEASPFFFKPEVCSNIAHSIPLISYLLLLSSSDPKFRTMSILRTIFQIFP